MYVALVGVDGNGFLDGRRVDFTLGAVDVCSFGRGSR